jgi:hypothetical protein
MGLGFEVLVNICVSFDCGFWPSFTVALRLIYVYGYYYSESRYCYGSGYWNLLLCFVVATGFALK